MTLSVPFSGCKVELSGCCGRYITTSAGFKLLNERLNWHRFLKFDIEVVIKHLNKSPLSPFVILWLAGFYFAIPIERKAYFIKLFAVSGNIFIGCNSWVLTSLNSILLGRQTIRIIPHWVQYVKPLQALKTSIDVRCNIAQWVTNMQTRARWVGKHIEHIKFGFCRVNINFIDLVFDPIFLPLLFNLFETILHI